jgi:DNA-binding NarL/FixJ family response regulator
VALLTDRPASYIAHLLLHRGLQGILHKRDSLEVFHSAVTTIMAGGLFVSPNICVGDRALFSRVLSDRETEVLQLLATGPTAASVGRQLGISAATVLTHRRNFMRKLGLRSELALGLFAVNSGLVAIEQLGAAAAKAQAHR